MSERRLLIFSLLQSAYMFPKELYLKKGLTQDQAKLFQCHVHKVQI